MVDITESPAGDEARSVADNPLRPDLDKAFGFLRQYCPTGPWVLSAKKGKNGPFKTRTFRPETEAAGRAWVERLNLDGHHIYFMVNAPMRDLDNKAKKEDVRDMVVLHLDIDPKAGEDPAAARAEAIAALEKAEHAPPPSVVIDSGGGVQALWFLDEPLPIDGSIPGAEDAELYNQYLEEKLGGDRCHNLDRVLRLPGTINWKREHGREPRLAELLQFHNDRRYPLAEFTAATRKRVSPTGGQAEVHLDSVPPFLASLDELPAAVTPRIRMLIVQGCDPDEPDKYPSRSEVTFAVACGLVRGGCTDEQIGAVFLDPELAISAHTREQKRPLDYVVRQIKNARDAVAEDGLGHEGRRVLNPAAPLEIAEQFKAELFPTAIHTNDDWLEWRAGAYRDVEDATMKSILYRELGKALVAKQEKKSVVFEPFHPNSSKVGNVLDALRGVAHQPAKVMAPPVWLEGDGPPPLELLAFRNGLYHVPTGALLPPTPRFFTRNALDLDFDPNAPEPEQWLAFVQQVFPDRAAAELLQDWFGYLLLPDMTQEKMLLLIGPPRSGKGTIQKVLTELVGRSNVCAPSVKALGTGFGLQPLIGKTVAFLSDMRLGGMADGDAIAETLLRITGRDDFTIDRKFKEAWEGRLSTRFVVSSNVLPKLPDASPALANRFSVLRMQQSFLGREDPGLADRLMAELPGILLWALVGWQRLRDRGRFVLPGTSDDAVQELLQLGSDVAAFVHERCDLALGREVEKDRLYARYREWCERTGRKAKHETTFATELYAATSNRVTPRRLSRGGERVNVYSGIALCGSGSQQEDDDANPPPKEDEPY